MSLSYCEICGDVIQGGSGTELPEGVICGGCFASRQAVVGSDSDDGERVQFECAYCCSLLRLKPVTERTAVRCPQCAETFFLLPDGLVESRLQGNTTAVISKEEAIRSLTPGPMSPAVTQSLRVEQDKTQPITPISGFKRNVLRELASKNLDVVSELPERHLLPVDTKRRERSKTERHRRTVEDGDTEVQLEPYVGDSALRASDEGKINLNVDRLKERQATRRLKNGPDDGDDEPTARGRGKKTKRERRAEQERREERKAKALARGHEVVRTRAQQTRRALLLLSLVIAPLLAAAVLLSMTTREAGFATRGQFGEQLQTLGHTLERGSRALNGLLPEAQRFPLPESDPGR